MRSNLDLIKTSLAPYEKDIAVELSFDPVFLDLLYSFQVDLQAYIKTKLEAKELIIYEEGNELQSEGLEALKVDISGIYLKYRKLLELNYAQAIRDDVLEDVAYEVTCNVLSVQVREYFEKKLEAANIFLLTNMVNPYTKH
ncbi:hypothetical protein HON22_06180 [Candidatus Peregrinibacteria bacterium]|jgi:hypothetical protein|nr:hypothetical protein [Candidatus Peregrinibacteria bacterium]